MAFSFDTFVKDQKQTAIDVVDTITPSQVKQVAQSYKEGLNSSPKQVINETLESITGVNVDASAGMDGIGKSVRQFVEGQAADLTMQLQQQILGCINTAIRDLMNKYPEIDFILNFEDRINGILGNFRNKLERKIDAELRKLAYNKIKIHQVALFKQRIRSKIQNICPAATPASVAEVQQFNRQLVNLFDKRDQENKVEEPGDTLTPSKIEQPKSPSVPKQKEPVGMSPKKVKEYKEVPGAAEQTANSGANQISKDIKEEAIKKAETPPQKEITQLVETEPKSEIKVQKKWGVSFYKQVTMTADTVTDVVATFFDERRGDVLNSIETGTFIADKRPTGSEIELINFLLEYTINSISFGVDPNTGLKLATISYNFELQEKKKGKKFLTTIYINQSPSYRGLGNSYEDAYINAVNTIEEKIFKDIQTAVPQKL